MGETETLAAQYRARRRSYLDAQRTMQETRASRLAFEREEDWLRFQLQEIREAGLETGERERLMAARDRVRDREEFERRARELQERLGGDEGSIIDHLESLAHLLRRCEGEPWSSLEERVLEIRETVRELLRDLPDPDEEPEIDLPALDTRLAQLDKLRRKYGDDEAAILEHAESLEERLQVGESLEDEEARHRRELEAARAALADAAQKLSKLRRATAKSLEKKLAPELAKLGMPHAQLALDFKRHAAEDGVEIEGRTWEPREGGLDTISAAFRSHHEMSWSDLARAASGGELSRVLLAIQAVVGDAAPVATWVFDEIDAGIGGETAQQVGRLLARLAERTQVLLVTHLPAIAARADHHFKVTKQEESDGVRAIVDRIEGDDRLRELARMLSGDERSSTALKHAEELLQASRQTSQSRRPSRPSSRRTAKSPTAPSGSL